jgi:hypothetical protein
VQSHTDAKKGLFIPNGLWVRFLIPVVALNKQGVCSAPATLMLRPCVFPAPGSLRRAPGTLASVTLSIDIQPQQLQHRLVALDPSAIAVLSVELISRGQQRLDRKVLTLVGFRGAMT